MSFFVAFLLLTSILQYRATSNLIIKSNILQTVIFDKLIIIFIMVIYDINNNNKNENRVYLKVKKIHLYIYINKLKYLYIV